MVGELLCLGDNRGEGGAVAEVRGQRGTLATKSLHLLLGVVSGEDVDGDDVRAGFSEREGHALAEAAGGARHDGGFAVQFEGIEY